MLQIPSEKVKD